MHRPTRKPSFWAWAVIAAISVVYAPMAIEFMGRFFLHQSLGLWDHTFSSVVGDERALGQGSIHFEQHQQYVESKWLLLAHTSIGGLAIVLCAAQFSRRIRRNIAVHRWIGRTVVALAAVGMVAAIAYLLRTGPEHTFDGPAFYLQLFGLAVATLLSATAGVVAIRAGQLAVHQMAMAFLYAFLLTAPMLRVEYVMFGLAWPTATQEVTNLAGGAVLAFWAPFGAILASRVFATDRVPPRSPSSATIDHVAMVFAGTAVGVLAWGYVRTFAIVERPIVVSAMAGVIAFTIASLRLRQARVDGNAAGAEEWRVHRLALMATPVLWIPFWGTFSLFFTVAESFYGAALTAPAVALVAGAIVVGCRRVVPRGTAAETPEHQVVVARRL